MIEKLQCIFTFISDFQLFRSEYHWRDFSSRNAHLVHQHWCRISFTLDLYWGVTMPAKGCIVYCNARRLWLLSRERSLSNQVSRFLISHLKIYQLSRTIRQAKVLRPILTRALTWPLTFFVYLFVYISFSYPAAFTITGDRATNLDQCLAFIAFSSWGSFTCYICCDTGSEFLRSHPKNRCNGEKWLP
jgi:hypothetical protein